MFKADLIDDENPNDVRSVIVKKVRAISSLLRSMPMHTFEIPQWLLKDLGNCVASRIRSQNISKTARKHRALTASLMRRRKSLVRPRCG